jgi:hypothetical protein
MDFIAQNPKLRRSCRPLFGGMPFCVMNLVSAGAVDGSRPGVKDMPSAKYSFLPAFLVCGFVQKKAVYKSTPSYWDRMRM